MLKLPRFPAPVACLLLTMSACATGDSIKYDYLISNGLVYDGNGGLPYGASIAISGDRIAAIGNLPAGSAIVEIDANGMVITPGFIDVHSHASDGLSNEVRSAAVPLLTQGLTTVLVNPDGGGPTDIVAQQSALMQHGLGVNVGQFVPHGSLRKEVIGLCDRRATSDDIAQMSARLEAGMRAGAVGLSSGLFYAPASFADTEELIDLARVAGRYGGVYSSHIRDEADYSIGLPASIDEVVRIAREANVRAVVTHIKAAGPSMWKSAPAMIERINTARSAGVMVWADQYPYAAASTALSSALIPRWALDGGIEGMRERFRDSVLLERIRDGIEEGLIRRGGAERIVLGYSERFSVSGRTLRAVADDWGVTVVEATLRLLQNENIMIISHNMDPADVRNFMREDWVMTSTDGGLPEWGVGNPHPRSFGAFARKIRKYVVEEQLLSLQAAIRSMTGLPANVYSLHDRGLIVPGRYADILVFDPADFEDEATFDEPFQLSKGLQYVFVNGVPAIENGRPTERRAGRLVRHVVAPL